jgi:hypothetical protein
MSVISNLRTAWHRPVMHARAIALVPVLVIGAASLWAFAPSAFGQAGSADPTTTQAPVQECADDPQDVVADEPFVRTELFFGTARPNGTAVSDEEWTGFLDREITARFPDGLTVMTGSGRWRESDGDIVQERSMLVILLYPREYAAESSAKIEEIRTAYEQAFDQESVLRSSDSLPVCVSF